MPISLSSMHPHIQLLMAEKLTFKETVALEQSSQVSKEIVQRVRTRFVPKRVLHANFSYKNEEVLVRLLGKQCFRKVSDFPRLAFSAGILSICGVLTKDFGEKLLDFVHRSGSICEVLSVTMNRGAGLCCPTTFYELLHETQVKDLRIYGDAAPEYVKKLPKNVKNLYVLSNVKNDDLKEIKTPNFTVISSEIDNLGVNRVLKEWIGGKREIECFFIRTVGRIVKKDVLAGIDCYKKNDKGIFELYNGKGILYVKIVKRGSVEAHYAKN